MRRPFTPEEDRVIVELYAEATFREIALQLGRTTVQARVQILIQRGLIRVQDKKARRPWTDAEDQEIRGRIGWDPVWVIAQELNRSINAVVVRSKRLGLSRKGQRRGKYTARAVADIFGVDSKTVTHTWMAKGWIHGRRSPLRCGRNRRWEFSFDQVERFVRDGQAHYGLNRITAGTWWRELAEKVARETPLLTTDQAARRLGLHRHTITRFLGEGRLTGIKTAGASSQGDWRISAAEIERFRLENPTALLQSAAVRRGRLTARRERLAVAA